MAARADPGAVHGVSMRSLRVRPGFAAAGALTIVLGIACTATREPKPEPLSAHPFEVDARSALEKTLDERSARAAAEIEQLGPDHPWAGVYYTGDGLGMNVTMWLAPKSGCVAKWTGCMGLYGANWGPVKEVDDKLVITFERVTDAANNTPFPRVLETFCEGDRRMLRSLDPGSFDPLVQIRSEGEGAVRRPAQTRSIEPGGK